MQANETVKNGSEKAKADERKKSDSQIGTPYDDVYRTMLNDCRSLIIPVINEAFHENYTGTEKIEFSPNEHFINKQDGSLEKRTTDVSFAIVGIETKKYLLECQSSSDSSMLVRIFEYATQAALDSGEIDGYVLKVEIPNCAILFLRSTKNTPDKMQIMITTPGGTNTFDVKVMKVQNYTLEEIFEKNLLFLIPFYIFTYEKYLKEYDTNEQKLDALKTEYTTIMDRLDGLMEEGKLSAYYRKIIIEMSEIVIDNIAVKYENVRKGVKDVMGGRVLEYEAKRIYREGEARGEARGEAIGELNVKKKMAFKLRSMGVSDDQIAQILEVSNDQLMEWFDEVYG